MDVPTISASNKTICFISFGDFQKNFLKFTSEFLKKYTLK